MTAIKNSKRWYPKQIKHTISFFRNFLFLELTNTLCVLARNASPPGIVATLDPADADNLNDFAPEADGRAVESLFVGVDAGSLPDQVCLVRADESGALEELPSAEGDDSCLTGCVSSGIELVGVIAGLPRMSMV